MAYIRALDHDATTAQAGAPASNTPADFLADYWAHPDRDAAQLVIFRDRKGLILLNRYPYANGHLLVALGPARAGLEDYVPEDRAHFWRLMELAMALCDEACRPQGMNAGLNLGRAAGAGLPEHLHGHVVPRWAGDTNFMSVLGEVRVIPDALEDVYLAYCAALPAALRRTGLWPS